MTANAVRSHTPLRRSVAMPGRRSLSQFPLQVSQSRTVIAPVIGKILKRYIRGVRASIDDSRGG